MKRIASLLAVSALAGCAAGPNYVAPTLKAPTQGSFAEAHGPAVLGDRPLSPRWWALFNDPALDRLVADAFAANTSIAQAEANLRRARATLSEQRAGLLPTTALSASYTRGRIGADNLGTGGGASIDTTGTTGTGTAGTGTTGTGTTGTGTTTGATTGIGTGLTGVAVTNASGYTYDYFQAGFDAAYEVDIFGRVRRSIEAARADTQAQAAALDGVRISIAAQVAQAYAAACADAEQADVARETARLQGGTLDLTRRLLDAGRGTRRDVDQAAVTVEQANAQVPSLEGDRRANLYVLAQLTGRTPAEADAAVAQCRTTPRVAGPIAVGDGAALLARRPDVRQAERTLAGDTARIGIETAALYPRIQIAGAVGIGAPKVSQLGTPAAFSYNVGPLLSWSFPNLAVARARIRDARAGADADLSAFQGAILTALQETEGSLARYTAALDRNAALGRAAAASNDAADLSRLRFTAGRDNFLNLLVAEQNRAAARQALAQSDAEVAQDAVSLFKALGGGWEDAPATTPGLAPAATPGTKGQPWAR